MHDILKFLPLVGIFLAFVGSMWLLVAWERKQANTWTALHEGEFDRVERGFRTESRRSGAMVHTTSYYRVPTTTVVFADGHAYTLRGRHEPPCPPGGKLRVWRNGLGGLRVERLDQ